uniref:Putative structural protein n=1 Tax=viral metagenome TaxID=1070528 RepID=A0A6H1ZTL9_9ZZZZ
MVTAKQVINSIKPNITKAPQGQTQKGSAGYDNPREDIEKIKGLREGSIQKVPVNADDITNKAYVDAQFPVTHASTTGQTANDHHVAFVKADADLLYGDIALEHGVNDVNSSSATAAQGALADTALQTETFVAATHTAIGDAAPHHSVNAANTTYTNLVNDSMADALHRHSELSASDGTPNPALSVDATGNVGIGTTGPGQSLEVFNASVYQLRLGYGSGFSFDVGRSGTDGKFRIQGNQAGVGMSDILLAPTSGNVGIGTTSPNGKLQVDTTTAGQPQIQFGGTARGVIGAFGDATRQYATYGVNCGLDGIGSGFRVNTSFSGWDWRLQADSTDTNSLASLEYINVAGTVSTPLVINSGGNVGIGTTGPASKLHVTGAGSADTVLTLGTQDSTPYIKSVNNNLIIQADVQNLFLRTAAGKYVNIDTGSGLLVSGNVGIGTTAPSEKLDVNSDAIRIRTAQTPASAGATGDTGMVCWDANYIYVCVATNTWKRSAIATW